MHKQQSVEQYKKCQIVLYNVVDRIYQAHNICYIEDCGLFVFFFTIAGHIFQIMQNHWI